MAKYSKADKAQAFQNLRKWLKPGDTVHTICDHVSRSGMSRQIRVVLISKDGETTHPNYAVGCLLGYSQARKGDGFLVGGCGMDMGFHVVHSLGYALFGEEAEKGTGKAANALRKAIYEADKHYWHQQGKTEKPNWTKPGREWFGGAGYALKHRWL